MADIKRPNYFTSQFLVEKDFNDEQAYHLQSRRRHGRVAHTFGVAEGLQVTFVDATQVRIGVGTAVDAQGRELVLEDPRTYKLVSSGSDVDVFLTLSFQEIFDELDRYPLGAINKFTRFTEHPLVQDSPTVPPDDGSVIVLARVHLNNAGAIESDSSINNAVRTVSSSRIAPLAIGTPQLADGAVTNAKIAAAAVNAASIADGSVTTAKLANGAVTLAKLAANSVDGSKIANGSVGTAQLADAGVTLAKLAASSVDGSKIASGSVGTAQLADAGVTLAKLAANSVDGSKIANGSVGTAQLADAGVTLAKLATGSVNATKIVNAGVGTAQIADGAVTLAKLASNCVDADKIADGAVGTAEILNASVVSAKLADGAVTLAKLADNSVDASKIADGSIITNKLADGCVGAQKIASGSIGVDALQAGGVRINALGTVGQFNGTFTLGPNLTTLFVVGGGPTPQFVFFAVTPQTPSSQISWDQIVSCSPSGNVTRVFTIRNLSNVTISFGFKALTFAL